MEDIPAREGLSLYGTISVVVELLIPFEQRLLITAHEKGFAAHWSCRMTASSGFHVGVATSVHTRKAKHILESASKSSKPRWDWLNIDDGPSLSV